MSELLKLTLAASYAICAYPVFLLILQALAHALRVLLERPNQIWDHLRVLVVVLVHLQIKRIRRLVQIAYPASSPLHPDQMSVMTVHLDPANPTTEQERVLVV